MTRRTQYAADVNLGMIWNGDKCDEHEQSIKGYMLEFEYYFN